MQALRIVLADDHAIFRDGLKLLLQTQADCQIQAEVDNLAMLKSELQRAQPDVLILDFHMPGGDSSALAAWCKQRYPEIRLVMLTGAQSGLILKQLVDIGADAVLLKESCGKELLDCLRRVMKGETVIPPRVRELVADADLGLTRREFQILKLLYDGLSNNDIGDILGLSPKTVDKHRENLMRKMQVNNIAQLVKKVHALNILDTQSPVPSPSTGEG